MARKKSGSTAKPTFDRREMEKLSAYISKVVADKNFDSPEEANAFIKEHITGLSLDDISLTPETPLEQAQAKMHEAFAARSSKKRVALAKDALKICADCADACVLLAEEDARTLSTRMSLYKQGVDAGRRALGPDMLEVYAESFWSNHATRPFMRALHGYGVALWCSGRSQEALDVFRELLFLNPDDNQGVRWDFLPALIESAEFDEAKKVLAEYEDDHSALVKYSRALLLYLTEGDSPAAREALIDAMDFNEHVVSALVASEKICKSRIAESIESYGPGSIEEAVLYVAAWSLSWLKARKGKLPLIWLLETLDEQMRQEQLFQTFPSLTPNSKKVVSMENWITPQKG